MSRTGHLFSRPVAFFPGILLTLLLGSGLARAQAPAFVQARYATPQTPQTSVSLAFTSAQTAGNLNVVAIGWNDVTAQVVSVSDTRGNTYAVAAGPTLQTGIQTQVIYYAPNIAAGSNTVTVTFSSAADYPDLRIAEYSGIATSAALLGGVGASGTAATASSGSFSVSSVPALLVGASYVQSHIDSAGSGYTLRFITVPDGNILEDRVVSTTGSYSATAASAGSGWVMQLAAFRGATAGGGDTQAPTAPGGLGASAASGTQINLSWTASTDNVAVTGYRVERCQGAGCSSFTQVGTPTATTFSDTGLTNATAYTYRVRAADAAGNLSAYSGTASATTPDTQAPAAPGSLTATAASATQIDLAWPAATDNVGVTGYRVERCSGSGCSGFAQIATPATPGFSDTGLSGATPYSYRVRAVDAAGNLGAYSSTASATTPSTGDGQAPTDPSGLGATAAASGTQIDLAWTASTDNVGVTGYRLERCQGASCTGFAQIAAPSGTSYSDTGLASGSAYRYRVRAADAAGNLSGYSAIASATTPDTQAPAAPSGLAATVASGTQINLTWTAATDNVGVTGYRVERCQGAGCSSFAEVGTPTTPAFSSTGLTPATSYSFRVRAIDAAGNLGAYSGTASATTTDTQAPTAPTGLGATAASSTQINLTWTASTDNVGVTGYRVERCQGVGCSSFAQVGTPTTPTYSSTGLAPLTSYSFRVRAIDAAGNLSSYSVTSTAATPADTQAPTAPTGLGATVASSTQINLAWTASTDNVGVTGYRVERCQGAGCSSFTQVGTPTTASYSSTGLTASTSYTFRVRAVDAAGNLGAYSGTATATTSSGASAPIAFVQARYSVPQTPQTAVSLAYTSAQTAGNLNVVIIGWNDATTQVLSVSDTRGNTYAVAAGPTVQAGVQSQVIYYAPNIAAGSNTVTVTFNAAADYPDLRIVEYSGLATSAPLDAGVGASGSGTNANSGSLTTSVASALLVSGSYVQSQTTAAGSGYTQRLITSPNGSILMDRVVSAVGTYSATASTSGSRWILQLAAFRAAPAGGGDTEAPSAPGGLAATAASSTQIGLSWTAATDNVGVTGYRVERCAGAGCSSFTQVGTPTATSYTDTALAPSTPYTYRVRAADAAGNLGAYSTTASASTPADTQAPAAPTGLGATAASSTQINLTWIAATDDVAVTGYRVERCQGTGCTGFAEIATPSGTSFSDTGLSAATSYSYRVRAADAAGNLGAYSGTASATTSTTGDSQAPTAPSALAATAVSSAQINLTWTASTDNVGVTGYRVERCTGTGCSSFSQVATPTTNAYSDSGLAASTPYSYRVRAADAAGNLSAYSGTASATTPSGGTAAPIAFVQARYSVPQTPQTAVSLAYTSAQTAGNLNVVIIGWNDATTQVLSVSDTRGNTYALAAGPTVQTGIQSQSIYYAPNIAAGSNTVTVAFNAAADYPDLRIAEYSGLAASVPLDAGVGASGTGTIANSGNLTATTVSTLLVGATYVQSQTTGAGAGYTQRLITSPNGSMLMDRVVTSPGTYSATASTNGSGWILQLAAFRGAILGGGDGTPPSVPTGLSANAPSASQVNLAWSASTDNVGVTGYRLERCQNPGCISFAEIAAPDVTSYSDNGLSAATSYSYRVRAGDAAGNLSPYSATATAITSGGAPPTISVSSPLSGATVSGVTSLGVNVSGSGILGVQFLIDGVKVGGARGAPYTLAYDTGLFGNGSHSVSAYMWDAAGNVYNAPAVTATFSNASPGNPAQTGLWSGLFTWPLVTVHTNLTIDGRVLSWDRMSSGNPDPILWNPVTSAFSVARTNESYNLFCAGHVTLPDGRIFSVGGHFDDHIGLRIGRIFNPATNQWTATPDMTYGRWYPTATTLPDGRILVLAGELNCRGCDVDTPEIYNPATNSWATLPSAALSIPYYPHVFVLPDGRILVTGTAEAPIPAIALNMSTLTWSTVDSQLFDAYSGVMYRPGKILKSGTSTDTLSGILPSSRRSFVIDTTASPQRWREVGQMAFPRSYHTLTILPDGNVLVTGGGQTTEAYGVATAVKQAELWSPTSETWTTLAAGIAPRLYHSTGLLLPDATILVSGGGRSPGPDTRDQENAEIFAPPYLFKGPRPVIASVQSTLVWNQSFAIATPDAARIASVALIGVGSVTHGFNMNQRYLPLTFAASSGTLTATAPANANLAPPGWYMLFLIDTNGVPSVGSFVHF